MIERQIRSRDNTHFKYLKGLVAGGGRAKNQCEALIDSVHVIESCLAADMPIRELILTDSSIENPVVTDLVARMSPMITIGITTAMFRDMTQQPSPVGVAVVIDIPKNQTESAFEQGDAMALDGVQDAGNVGSLLRVAACSGVRTVVLGEGCAGAWSSKTLRAGQGAHFSLQLIEGVNLPGWLEEQKRPVIGATGDAKCSIYEADFSLPSIWVFGSEGRGLSGAVRKRLDTAVSIPMVSTMESLNVGAAAAVCLYERFRQRMKFDP
jgi:RNA methyltransferase, TrmH family